MPRPVKDDPRDHFKTFRFTAGEITRLTAKARASGQTLSDYVRALTLDGQDDGGTGHRRAKGDTLSKSAPPRRANDATARILAEQMRKVGVNLNQIAHRMNEQRIAPPRELALILDEIRAYVRQVRDL